jgi:type I restriction enzyme M protein
MRRSPIAHNAQVAELDKILHNATNTTIKVEDTLANIDGDFSVKTTAKGTKGRYNLLICNPPFGSKIVVKDPAILAKFELAHEWKQNSSGEWLMSSKLLKAQATGILFVEACVRQAMNDGGRAAIIVPNGYLGNRTARFRAMREWILRHSRVAAIVSFPRFTFKTSGADVSASVILLERRDAPSGPPTARTTRSRSSSSNGSVGTSA